MFKRRIALIAVFGLAGISIMGVGLLSYLRVPLTLTRLAGILMSFVFLSWRFLFAYWVKQQPNAAALEKATWYLPFLFLASLFIAALILTFSISP